MWVSQDVYCYSIGWPYAGLIGVGVSGRLLLLHRMTLKRCLYYYRVCTVRYLLLPIKRRKLTLRRVTQLCWEGSGERRQVQQPWVFIVNLSTMHGKSLVQSTNVQRLMVATHQYSSVNEQRNIRWLRESSEQFFCLLHKDYSR